MTPEGFGRLVAFLSREEGCMLRPYRDVAGYWTVGYGHRCAATQPVITHDEAVRLLQDDAAIAVAVVETDAEIAVMPDDVKLALAAFVFNVGEEAYKSSTLRVRCKAGEWQAAADEFMRWRHARVRGKLVPVRGLIERRERERFFFLQGVGKHEAMVEGAAT